MGTGEKLESAGPESSKGRRLKPHNAHRLATYCPSSGDKLEAQGLRAPRGQDLRLTITVGWQPTARVGGTTAKRRVQEHQGAKT